jgi:hypothetical protein
MPYTTTSHPLFDRFNAKNQGEDAQYALTRAAVLTALMNSPRVLQIYAFLGKETGLDDLTDEVMQTGDALAKPCPA